MVEVPAGWFIMGADDGDPDERPGRRVYLDAFRIDRLEVTLADYHRCVRAARCRPAQPFADVSRPRQPVVGVSWHDAAGFCSFAGKRLPTEAEWEKAARGSDGRAYPWGSEVDCRRANFGHFAGEGGLCAEDNPGRPIDVGSRPAGASPCGALDLAGNVWEWTQDWYDAAAYRAAGPRNPRGPARGRDKVLRGGACCSLFILPRAANRLHFPPGYRDGDIGFRCAADAAN